MMRPYHFILQNTFSFEADSNQNISLSFIGSNRTRGSSVTGILADHHHDLAGAPASIILVYDVSVLMSVSKELARKYVLFGNNILSVCIHNRRAANSCGRKHLIRVWKVIEMCLRFGTAKWQNYLWLNDCNTDDSDEIDSKSEGSSTSDSEEDSIEEDGPWIMHPFGRYLINNLLDYFGRINDYQTAAIIICLLSARVKRDFTIPQIKQNVSSCDALISTYHNRSHILHL
ncbi:unnamed protein product [Dracunculus medinensis]|uniref:WAPL domain-containing protein n=1 Tax=Dracunculus medinensis TaxID=318479 RepID=A0A0N4UNV1_DRAME|nr:unnamed protein product [Dracunculus medinensis]